MADWNFLIERIYQEIVADICRDVFFAMEKRNSCVDEILGCKMIRAEKKRYLTGLALENVKRNIYCLLH